MRIAILDVANQDIGIKILFPSADYYIFQSRIGGEYLFKKHNINILKNIENINDKNYDYLFVIISLFNSIKIYREDNGKLHHNFIEITEKNFLRVNDIINNNNFKNVSIFANCDMDYEPNIIYKHFNIKKNITFFKRNCSNLINYPNNVFPFPYFIFLRDNYCIIDSLIDLKPPINRQKENRLFFSGAVYCHIDDVYPVYRDRKGIIDKIRAKIPIFYQPHNMNHSNYLNEMQLSKFCLDIVGAGDPNLRTFEILHCGSLLISQRTPLVWNFENGDSFSDETIFDDENDLYHKLFNLVTNEELYNKCLNNQLYLVQKYMTAEYMRNYIIEKINCNNAIMQ